MYAPIRQRTAQAPTAKRGEPLIAAIASMTEPHIINSTSVNSKVWMPNSWRTRTATIGLNRIAEAIIAAGTAIGPSQGAVTKGVIVSTAKDDAVSISATLA